MEQVSFHGWLLQSDAALTRRAYAAIPNGSPERCGCVPCRNFAAVRQLAYLLEGLSLLDHLGIDAGREAEVYHIARLESGLHWYGGWFHFIGAIEIDPVGVAQIGDHLLLYFSRRVTLVPEAFAGYPLVQLEFETKLPWTIDVPEVE